MNTTTPRYRGRFAPSPTGPLHFGSLIAALGSYLTARQQGGEWFVRMEDIDPPREVAGAAMAILRTLERLGFEWDGEVLFQSKRHEAYLEALAQLQREGQSYRCRCSRKEILTQAKRFGLPAGVYPGGCRTAHVTEHERHAIRLLVEPGPVVFNDALQGHYIQEVASTVGDFVLRRADGLFAYQLAVVVDDAAQGITEVVRGSDLLDNTPRQILLQQALGLPTPQYCHLPVALNREGQKLSKQTFAPALDDARPIPALWQALQFLGQQPPREIREGGLDDLWRWALNHWHPAALPRTLGIPISQSMGTEP